MKYWTNRIAYCSLNLCPRQYFKGKSPGMVRRYVGSSALVSDNHPSTSISGRVNWPILAAQLAMRFYRYFIPGASIEIKKKTLLVNTSGVPVPHTIDTDFWRNSSRRFANDIDDRIVFQCHSKDGARISKKRMGLRIGDRKGQSGPL